MNSGKASASASSDRSFSPCLIWSFLTPETKRSKYTTAQIEKVLGKKSPAKMMNKETNAPRPGSKNSLPKREAAPSVGATSAFGGMGTEGMKNEIPSNLTVKPPNTLRIGRLYLFSAPKRAFRVTRNC